MAEPPRKFTHNDYTVGWICALSETELVAAGAMLDEEHPVLPAADPKDMNSYLLGRIGDHNVVIACLPAEMTGKVSAATVAKDLVRSFTAVRFGLMVGIGGGAPYYKSQDNNEPQQSDIEDEDEDSEEDNSEETRDIRLGDVVISLQSKSTEAVVQYDFGKSMQGKEFVRIGGQLNKPPSIVLNAISMLRGQHQRKGHRISDQLSKTLSENPLMAAKFQYPGSEKDRLFKSEIIHVEGKKSCKACCGPLDINLVKRKVRFSSAPSLHYGTIGSADQVMKDATLRDRWARMENILCFEMEAAGLMDSFPCLVIRGICDYADSHKNKIWQPYAAATAAAYAKELLLVIPGQRIMDLPSVEKVENKIIQRLGTWRRSDEQEKCLQAFRTTIYEAQKNFNPEREDGTCLWCLDDPRFCNWRDRATSCLLWVTADPGCGKSVLSRALVDERLLESTPNEKVICYFFFKDTSEEQRSPVSAFAALLHQLFISEAGAKVMRHALPAFRRDKDKVSQNFEGMWKIVQDIALDPDCGKIVFLLDALDECQGSEQQNLITKLKRLEKTQLENGSVPNLQFFITSRPYWDIERGFDSLISDIPSIRLRGENQSETLRSEIDRVIRARISRLGHQITSQKARDQLLEGLLKVGNRTYLWLHLVFGSIESKPAIATETVKNLLANMPETLEEAYRSILHKSEDQEQAKRLLHIVVAAARPLSLNEIGTAFYITEEARTCKDLDLPRSKQLEITIRHLCGLFVTIVDQNVFLIHQTAKEFLVAPDDDRESTSIPAYNRDWKHSLYAKDSNFLLAQVCMWYLRLEELRSQDPFQGQGELTQLTWRYNFLEYSALNWAAHFRAAMIPKSHAVAALGLELCHVQANQYMAWELAYWAIRWHQGRPAGSTTLHLVSYLGLQAVVADLLAGPDVHINERDGEGRTPLWWAASEGHGAVVGQLLTAPGIDVNAADRQSQAPLWYAASQGHEDVVAQLLTVPSIDVNVAYAGRTPLWWAAYQGREAMVGVLLSAPSINVNAADNVGRTPLWWAAFRGHKSTVALLLGAPDIDANAADWEGRTPLYEAACEGHEAVVSKLLEKGVRVNIPDKRGRTPLWRAALEGYEAVVGRLLSASSIDVNATDNEGETPLWRAAFEGHEVVVNKLLGKGADIHVECGKYGNALQVALQKGHKGIVQLLLDKGATLP